MDGGGAARCVLALYPHDGWYGSVRIKGLISVSEVRKPICERESCRIAARLLECRLVTIAGQELHHVHVVLCWARGRACQTLSVERRIPGLLGSCAFVRRSASLDFTTPAVDDSLSRRWICLDCITELDHALWKPRPCYASAPRAVSGSIYALKTADEFQTSWLVWSGFYGFGGFLVQS